MKKEKMSFITSLLFVIIGIIIFIKPDVVVKFTSYLFGGVFLLVGIYKCINYYIKDKNLKVVNYNELAFGIVSIVLGLLFILLAGTIELLIRICMGIWLILQGVGYIMRTFYTNSRDKKFVAMIITGLIFIGAGLYIVLVNNLVLSTIGLLMAIYGVIEFVGCFIYRDSNINSNKNNELREVEVIEEKDNDEKIEEVELEVKETKKKKTKKGSKK